MFGRKVTSGKDALAQRVRQLGESRPPVATPEITSSHAPSYSPSFSADPSVAKSVRNKERAPRQSLFRTGTLVTSGGGQQNVAVKDVSITGARIEFHTRNELPAVVLLIEPTLKLRKRARVVWQAEGIAGLQFIDD